MKSKTISKYQHYVPRFYLKNFSNKKDQIHTFSKKDNNQFHANISNVAGENYFYAIPDFNNASENKTDPPILKEDLKEAVEKILSFLDNDASKALKQLLENVELAQSDSSQLMKIDKQLRFDISHFCVLQDIRTREHRTITRQLYDGTTTQIARVMYDRGPLKKIEGIKSEDLNVVHSDKAIDLFHIRFLLDHDHNSSLSNLLFHKKWVIGVNNTEVPLFTSDHPLGKYNYEKTPYGTGYGSDEISIPLSSKYILILICPQFWKDITVLNNNLIMLDELTEDSVAFYNHHQVANSYNYVFSQTKEFEKMDEYLKTISDVKNPLRSRIKFL